MQQRREAASDFREAREAWLPEMALLHRWPDAAARGTIVVIALILAWLTWAHWGDIQVDCGRELYVPAEILRGKLLYRDLWYPYGPLEPYLAAALLGLFGQHLSVFYLFGLTLATACALLSFDIGKMLAGRAVGVTAAVAILLQGFQSPPFLYGSIFNYIFPYSYAALLGLLIALLCALFAVRHALGRSGHNLMLAGLAAGFALLCKQEFGASCYIMLAFLLVTEAVLQQSARALFRGVVECAPGVALWVMVYGWFFWSLTPSFMLFGNWVEVPGANFMQTSGRHIYSGIGLRFIPIELILLVLDAIIAMLLWFWIAKIGAARAGRFCWRSAAAALLVIGVAMAREFDPLAMYLIAALLAYPRGMFFIGCAFLIYSLYALRNNRGDRLLMANATFAIFALVPAVRVLAQVVSFGYSIFYAVPLLLVFMVVVKRCVDAATSSLVIEQRRRLTNLLLATEVSILALILIPTHSKRTARFDTSWGNIYLEPAESTVAHQIYDFVLEQKRHGRRVLLLPEFPMIYAFTGTEAPSRWYTLTPGFLSPSQEGYYVEDLKRANPDYIVLTNRSNFEHGAPYFGIDYDKTVYHWIEINYRVAGYFGRFRRDGSGPLTAILYKQQRSSEPIISPDPVGDAIRQ